MKKVKLVDVTVALSFFISLSALATNNNVLSKGSAIGTFNDFKWGDYPHVTIVSEGKKLTFFGHKGPISVFDEHEKKLKGVKIKIFWEKVRAMVPEAGEKREITRTINICSFTKIDYVSISGAKIEICSN